MSSQQILYKFLKDKVYNGKLGVPRSVKTDKLNNCSFFSNGYRSAINQHNETELIEIKNKMKENFYSSALVPKCLKLLEINPEIVDQEIDCLNQIVTYTEENTGKWVGHNFMAVWDVDENYDGFEVDPLLWTQTAGKITHELASNDKEAVAIWRNYQYLLFYHLSQRYGKLYGKKQIVYTGIGYFSPEHRKKSFLTEFLGKFLNYTHKDFILATCNSYERFIQMYDSLYNATLTGRIPYDQIQLNFKNGQSVFEDYKGCIAFQIVRNFNDEAYQEFLNKIKIIFNSKTQ